VDRLSLSSRTLFLSPRGSYLSPNYVPALWMLPNQSVFATAPEPDLPRRLHNPSSGMCLSLILRFACQVVSTRSLSNYRNQPGAKLRNLDSKWIDIALWLVISHSFICQNATGTGPGEPRVPAPWNGNLLGRQGRFPGATCKCKRSWT